MERDTIDEWLKRAQLAVVLGLVAFAPALFGAVRVSELIWVQWGIIAAAALWLVRLWVRPRFRYFLPPLTWAIVPFLGYAAWRYATADIEFVARQEFLQIALLALLFLTVTNNLYNQESLRLLAFGLVAVTTVISMYAVYQWLAGSNTVFGFERGAAAYRGRASGTYVCPNHYAGLAAMCLPIALTLALSSRLGVLPRVFLVYAAVCMFVGLGASGSRGGWIAAAASLLVMVAVLATRRGFRIISLLVALAVFAGGSWLYEKALKQRVQKSTLEGHEKENRLWYWRAGYEMFRDHPWIGVGPDHFDHRYRAYRPEKDKTQARPLRAHNDYLNTLADYGVVGLLLILIPIGVAIWMTWRMWPYLKREKDDLKGRESTRSALVLGTGCGLVAILIHSLFDFNLHIPANAMIAMLLFAILACHTRFASSRWWVSARWPLKLAGSVVLLAAIGALAQQSASRTREVFALKQAQSSKDRAIALAAYKRASAAEPRDPEAAFNVGEYLRAIAWLGEAGHKETAREALGWFEKASQLNKWDPLALIRQGMCLDWMGQHAEALPLFEKAVKLDPNYYYTRAMMGWHYMQADQLNEALLWYNKSIGVNWLNNPDALAYRQIILRRLAQTTNGLPTL